MSSSQRPVVSILLPVRDAAETLDAALRSVLRQQLRDWECHIVDDGSGDGGPAIATAAVARDSRFRFHAAVAPAGLVHALNRGLGACRGRYVARMDADDLMHRARLRDQVELLEHEAGLAGAGCHVRLFPRRSLGRGLRRYESWLNQHRAPADIARSAFVECPLAHPTWILRREIYAAYPYHCAGWPEDYDLLLRLINDGHRLGVVPRRLLAWRNLPDRLSLNDTTYGIDRFTACKAEHLARGFLAHHSRYALWGYGATGRALCRGLAYRGRHPGYIVEIHPRRLGNRTRAAPFVSPEQLVGMPRLPLVVSVAGSGPRGLIRAFLREAGFVEGTDFLCAA